MRDFGIDNLMPEDSETLKQWHSEQLGDNWDFKKEMIKYCRADVELLSNTILKFRKLFRDNLDADPLQIHYSG